MIQKTVKFLISRHTVSIILFSLLCYAQAGLASAIPTNQAVYRIKYDGVTIGTSTVTLKSLPANQYFLSIRNHPAISFLSGNVLESSTGLWAHSQPIPLHYFYSYRYFNKRRQIELFFNWHANNVTTRVNGLPWIMPVTSGTQDKLSYELQLRQDLIAGKNKFIYPVADGGKIKHYQFFIVGNEIITTPLGTFNTIKIIRSPMPGKNNVTLWIARQFNYQIVRIERSKNIMDHGIAEIISYKKI